MFLIRQIQIDTLNEVQLDGFLKRLHVSVYENLNIDFNEFNALKETVLNVIGKFGITKEALIEDYVLLYFQFPVLQEIKLPDLVGEILLSKSKNEQMKIEELTEYLIANQ